MSYTNPLTQSVLTLQNSSGQEQAFPFLQNLTNLINTVPTVPVDYTTTAANGAYQSLVSASSAATVTNFFNLYDSTTQLAPPPGYTLPLTWSAFIQQFQTYTGASAAQATTILNAFVTSYESFMGIPPGSNPPGGDFSVLTGVTAANIQSQFESSFTSFLQHYPFPNPKSFSFGTPTQFFNNWTTFMTQTAVIQNTTGSTTGLPSYEQIWTAYGFPASSFAAALNTFYQNDLVQTGNGVAANGYFSPSQAYSAWIQSVSQQYINSTSITSTGTSQVPSGTSSNEVQIINQITQLLINIIGIEQNITASQATYLNFLTQWQNSYNDELNQIPNFANGDGTAIDANIPKADQKGNDTVANEEAVQSAVNPVMQALQTKTQARQQAVGNVAKNMQSILNQSQTDANAATNMVTAFLTELETILAAVFKG